MITLQRRLLGARLASLSLLLLLQGLPRSLATGGEGEYDSICVESADEMRPCKGTTQKHTIVLGYDPELRMRALLGSQGYFVEVSSLSNGGIEWTGPLELNYTDSANNKHTYIFQATVRHTQPLSQHSAENQGAPKLELSSACYGDWGYLPSPAVGIPKIKVSDWIYWDDLYGELVEEVSGAKIVFDRRGPPCQAGRGANGKNHHFGLSCWLTWQFANGVRPANWPSNVNNGHGDINADVIACSPLATCSALSDPNGDWSGSSGSGSTRTLTCDDGYSVVGHDSVTCHVVGGSNTDDSHHLLEDWDGLSEEDDLVPPADDDQSQPDLLHSGSHSSSSSDSRSHGYTQVEWDRTPGYCSRAACTPLTDDHGDFVGGFGLGDRACLECDAGYRFRHWSRQCTTCTPSNAGGESESESDGGGSGSGDPYWNPWPTYCKPSYCSKLPSVSKGYWSYCRRTDCQATLHCNNGYGPQGASQLTCEGTGYGTSSWDQSPGTCVHLRCDMPSDANGEWDGCTALHGMVDLTCDSGFKPKNGDSWLTCVSDGAGGVQWDDTPAQCVADACEPLADANGGSWTPSVGSVGTTASLSCPDGFVISGASSTTCSTSNGAQNWSPAPGQCVPASCTRPQDSHGSWVGSTGLGDAIQLACGTGYVVTGDPSLTCVASGPGAADWDGTPGMCTPADCSVLPDLPHGQGTCVPPVADGTLCSVTCSNGYEQVGSPPICQLGQWTIDSPTCAPVNCAAPTDAHGSWGTSTVVPLGQSASLTCHAGYEASGNTDVTCSPVSAGNSALQPAPGSCVPSACPGLVDPAHGDFQPESGVTGASSTLTCDNGYFVTGDVNETRSSIVINCLAQSPGVAAWSGAPTCSPAQCPPTPSDAHGSWVSQVPPRTADTAILTCEAGFHIEGELESTTQATISCVAAGPADSDWNKDFPTCTPSTCPALTSTGRHGSWDVITGDVGDSSTLTCLPGYTVTGSPGSVTSTANCIANPSGPGAVWDSDPVCEASTCPNQTPANAVFSGNNVATGQTAVVSCVDGFEVSGGGISVVVTCVGVPDGTASWDQEPDCVPSTCSALSDPVNGNYDPETGVTGDDSTLTCADGYLVGSCEGASGPVTQVDVGCVGDSPGASEWSYAPPAGCTVPGPSRQGPAGLPICVSAPCAPNLPNEPHGSWSCQTGVTGSQCSLSCSNGYEIDGTSTVATSTCVATGPGTSTWDSFPSCVPSSCPALVDPSYGDWDPEMGTTGSTSTLTCVAGFAINGTGSASATQTCVGATPGTSTWGTLPECVSVSCPALPVVAFSSWDTSSGSTGDVATLTCSDGYFVSGPQPLVLSTVVTCEGVENSSPSPSSEWTPSPDSLVCNPAACDPLADVDNGNWTAMSGSTGSSSVLQCDDGYFVRGLVPDVTAATAFCVPSGPGTADWINVRECEPASCPNLNPDPANGNWTETEGVTGDSTVLACENGFQIVGSGAANVSIACAPTGPGVADWNTAPLPSCEATSCPHIADDPVGNWTAQDGVTGDSATLSCPSGFYVEAYGTNVTSLTVECDGIRPTVSRWSDTVRCVPAPCPTLDDTPFGTWTTLDGVTGSNASLTCLTGYHLNDKLVPDVFAQLNCVAGGPGAAVWDAPVPFCVENPDPDPICERGVSAADVCCAAECITCGGPECANAPGGADNCCAGNIVNENMTCTLYAPPCVLPDDICSYIPGWDSLALRTSLEPILDVVQSGFNGAPNMLAVVFHVPLKFEYTRSTTLFNLSYAQVADIEAETVLPSRGMKRQDGTFTGRVDNKPAECYLEVTKIVRWRDLIDHSHVNCKTLQLPASQGGEEVEDCTGRIDIELFEEVYFEDNQSLEPLGRVLHPDLVFTVRFKKRVTASLGGLKVYAPPNVLAAIIRQDVEVLLGDGFDVEAKIHLYTSVQYPFRLCSGNPTLGESELCHGSPFEVNVPASLGTARDLRLITDCPEPPAPASGEVAPDCRQTWEFFLDPDVDAGVCELDGSDYRFATFLECQPSLSGTRPSDGAILCPLQDKPNAADVVSNALSFEFSLDSEYFCPQLVDSVQFTARLQTYTDSTFARPKQSFLVGDTVWFLAEVQLQGAAVDIAGLSFEAIQVYSPDLSLVPEPATGPAVTGLEVLETAACPSCSNNQAAFKFQLTSPPFDAPTDSWDSFDVVATLNIDYGSLQLLGDISDKGFSSTIVYVQANPNDGSDPAVSPAAESSTRGTTAALVAAAVGSAMLT